MSPHEKSGFEDQTLENRWVVKHVLGSGSFGVVHAGIDLQKQQNVAIKFLHPQFVHHGETLARFWNEAEALRRLQHPNVLVLLDVGESDEGVPFLITELLEGETLRALMDREGTLSLERTLRLLGPAAHALHHAHQLGIVHRDLKPENIFRMRKEGLGTTKILDFGVAKLLDTEPGRKLSQTGMMLGTMAYSAPEQLQGVRDIDHRADQFGFAALIFEVLTGKRPFPSNQPFALFQAIMTAPRPKVTDLRPEFTSAIDDVFAQALAIDRSQRFETLEQFYLALMQTFEGKISIGEQFISHSSRTAHSAYQPIQEEITRGEVSPVEMMHVLVQRTQTPKTPLSVHPQTQISVAAPIQSHANSKTKKSYRWLFIVWVLTILIAAAFFVLWFYDPFQWKHE